MIGDARLRRLPCGQGEAGLRLRDPRGAPLRLALLAELVIEPMHLCPRWHQYGLGLRFGLGFFLSIAVPFLKVGELNMAPMAPLDTIRFKAEVVPMVASGLRKRRLIRHDALSGDASCWLSSPPATRRPCDWMATVPPADSLRSLLA